jgi:4-methyl-5(b-hydroxyethyl)-thiazole monophosphate biosynthesis
MMSKRVLVPIADGVEEIEAVCIIDVLRRAGAEVTVAAVDQLQVTASRGVKIVADCQIAECEACTYDLIALPGGMPGAENLRNSQVLTRMLVSQHQRRQPLGAICAAPAVVLQRHGLLAGRRATAHPAFMDRLDAELADTGRVVNDGHITTSRGPGTAIEFALALVTVLFGREKANDVAAPMQVPRGGRE